MSTQKEHWENIYTTSDHSKVGWYQESPDISLKLLSKIHADASQSIIDVGCGASLLVDHLIDKHFRSITLVDLSETALLTVKNRLRDRSDIPEYLCLDITTATFNKTFDLWHDRAVFHFLTDAVDRKNYMLTLEKSLSDSGRAIIGTFSLTGPDKCSGLDIVQYDNEKMNLQLPHHLELEDSVTNTHVKPDGMTQEYIYFIIRNKNG